MENSNKWQEKYLEVNRDSEHKPDDLLAQLSESRAKGGNDTAQQSNDCQEEQKQ